MNWRLQAVQFFLPELIKKKKLKELFHITAQAFQREPHDLKKSSFEECLREYALFTKTVSEQALKTPEQLTAIKRRLYQNAYQMGQRLRAELRIRSFDDVLQAGKILYRILNIDFQGNQSGDVIITRCFFSRYYSGRICEVISALDEGVLAGLSNGGTFTFSHRITQGNDCCKAKIRIEEHRK